MTQQVFHLNLWVYIILHEPISDLFQDRQNKKPKGLFLPSPLQNCLIPMGQSTLEDFSKSNPEKRIY